MPIIKTTTTIEISEAEAVHRLREYIAGLPPAREPMFKPGEAVLLVELDCIGVVYGSNKDGDPSVFYLDEAGEVTGPSFGWDLERLDL